ncbi:Vesicle-mediated ER to Golgi transport protein [Recurvomyces mirabilis]|uniref:Vesicle-mediated ER to Golgi transport protein n=1 Tax=Recurvomyces mirabilis TaxID=574656 RepID=A0AAE0TNW0_9PEZI|nr:Vesicle-mediated ER to Golgi transport protein [Recurvomyces mirabilis]KAK5153069.1 Vesicle-mediated ER to Golgi transport protein [Recurvomyces mirabilis]
MLKTPPLQTATATIDTLSGRLQSATLLEDRRAAILGLRSFAKQYPASVAGGSVRELIATLRRDGLGEAGSSKDGRGGKGEEGSGDVDTIRLVLETLLMLCNPDSNSPEASDELAYFMADEFSMRQENVTLLLSLLDPTSPYADYYSRLYSVQLLQATCAARPERLQECVLGAPLGVSRLVGVLDDGRDAVRNAGLLLLVDLTSGANEELRKIVAFEDVFPKVFALIRSEGGLAEAGITAQDCLTLLANLIKGSPSNQTMFRESGCVSQMVKLLEEAFPPELPEAPFTAQSREKAAWGLLQLLTQFLEPGEKSTAQNQTAFFRVGTAQVLIDLGFIRALPPPIRTSALRCAAVLIASNAPLQEAFASLLVDPSASRPVEPPRSTLQPNGTKSNAASARNSARPSAEQARQYIIEALLDLALTKAQEDPQFRMAGCSLVRAYLTNHDRIKAHFLNRAIAGHAEHEAAANVLSTLLQPTDDAQSVLYASWIVTDLVAEEPEAQAALAAVKEGDENEGEDVLTLIQTLGSQLQSAIQASDERLVVAYAGLLTVLLWDFADGINNLLIEGSGLVQSLVTAINPIVAGPLIAGMAAILLGTIYEFSTKDSPIPRRTLAPLLKQKLGRTKYLDSLASLRKEPAVRDFDIEEAAEDTILSSVFIDLFMTEYSRLRRAIDKDPGIEVLPSSAIEAGVDRDVLDDLRQQLQSAKDALSQAQQDALATSQQHEQDRMNVSKEMQTATAEVDRLRRINQAMQQGHESEFEKVARQHDQARQNSQNEHQRALESVQQESGRQLDTRLREQGAASAQKMQEYERRLAELGNTFRSEKSKYTETSRQLEALTTRHSELGTSEQQARQSLQDLTQRHEKATREQQVASTEVERLTAEVEDMKARRDKRDALVERLRAQCQATKEELRGREDELATERSGFADLEKELEGVKAELADAKGAVSTSTKSDASKDDNEKLVAMQEELETAREGESSAKAELESMLLVMGDIEAKRDALRKKVKELGGAVSDDEDDDEDDEEEEGEEEEDDEDVD